MRLLENKHVVFLYRDVANCEGQSKSLSLILCYESCKVPKNESFHHNLIHIQMVLAYQSIYSRAKHQYHYKYDEQRCVPLLGK